MYGYPRHFHRARPPFFSNHYGMWNGYPNNMNMNPYDTFNNANYQQNQQNQQNQQMQQNPPFQQPPFAPMQPPRPRPPFQGILSHFQKEDGQMDFEKMFATANQISNTVKQISPLLKLFQQPK